MVAEAMNDLNLDSGGEGVRWSSLTVYYALAHH